MYAFFKGKVEEIFEDHIEIDVRDVGYNVFIPSSYVYKLSRKDEIKIYTYTSVHEDSFLIYGFLSREELNLYKKLITVNGIGPKAGLSLLSTMEVDELRYAILSSDIKRISMAPGIGKKTAERLVIDLKDKLSWNEGLVDKEIKANNNSLENKFDSEKKKEVIAALTALGYASSEAHKAVNSIEFTDEDELEDILKEALKILL